MNYKLLLSTSLTIFITSQTVFANDKNNHNLIFDFSQMQIDQEYGNTNFLGNESNIIPGIGYGYNINLGKNIFLKPKVMFYFADTDIKDKESNFKSSYSTIHDYLIDIGYKHNKLSYYTSLGIRTATFNRTESTQSQYWSYTQTNSGGAFGLGASYDLTNNLDINVGYQYSKISYQPDPLQNLDVKFQDIKLGISYKF